jgi:hypothetical protein
MSNITGTIASQPTPLYADRYDIVSTTIFYRGQALPGSSDASAVWRLWKVTVNTSGTTTASVTWANGTNSFDKVWNDRATYTYS